MPTELSTTAAGVVIVEGYAFFRLMPRRLSDFVHMAEYDETTYGDRIAEVYDLFYGRRVQSRSGHRFSAPLASKRRALELGIGTGRIAIPLEFCRLLKRAGLNITPAGSIDAFRGLQHVELRCREDFRVALRVNCSARDPTDFAAL